MTTDKRVLQNIIERVNLGDLVTRSAARVPNQLAIVDGERRITYREFNEWVNRTAHGLVDLGYGRGDVLALMATNCAEFLIAYFACAKLGVVCVPINLFWRHNELAYVLDHAKARGIVVEATLIDQLMTGLPKVPAVRDVFVIETPNAAVSADLGKPGWRSFASVGQGMPAAEPEFEVGDRDPMSYLYTSGTTSSPKGVVGSHLAIYLGSIGNVIDCDIRQADRMAAMMPLFHTGQLNAFCTPAIAVGATSYLMRGFDPVALLDLIEREKISFLFGLPMMYRAMLDENDRKSRDLASLRLAVYAMAPMPDTELKRALAVMKCDFALMFGQTEMSPTTTLLRPHHQFTHPGAVGTACVNVQVAVMDENGGMLPTGEKGEIVYRSPQVLTAYLYNEAATDEAFKHGWFHSGDAGYFDQDGVLWFEDRFKDVIKSGGENVASLEVEKALYEVEPRIQETAVVGLPHERWGEAITAVVVPRPGEKLDQADLMMRLRDHLSPFKCPKAVIIAEALPKTATGKIQKHELRKLYGTHYES